MTTLYFIREWERELDYNFTSEQIKRLMGATHHTSISSHIQEMSYKFLTRWYRTPARLAQIYPSVDINCWGGCNQRGLLLFLHLRWHCPKIKVFWEEMAPWIKKITLRPIEFSLLHSLFHGMPSSPRFYKRSVTPHLLNAAKILIPRFWKLSRRLTIMDWKREVENIMEAERWTHIIDLQNKF